MRSVATTTDGWRGLPGPDWSELHLLAAIDHAAASGALGDRVLVGFDARAGAAELAVLAADLLTARNITAILATGPAPTPACGLFTHTHPDVTGAVIATASHNPPGYIGVKLRDADGQGIAWPQPADNAAVAPPPVPTAPHLRVDVASFYAARTGQALADTARCFGGDLIIDAAHGAVAALAPHLPGLAWHRGRPLPFFAGHTPDPASRPAADAIAASVLGAASAPGNTMVAMTDGDGDRLALVTARSGYVASPEQAAILLRTGLPAARLITTTVAPSMLTHAARARNLAISRTPVGFKHIVAAQRQQPAMPTLGVEPNGALAWTTGNGGYFERDSLTALATITTHFTSVQNFDDAVANLRRDHPHPQRIVTIAGPVDDTLGRLRTLLADWRASTEDDVTVFDNDAHHRVVVRASGTEPGTRLYLETDPPTTEHITAALSST
jgi:phosphomannomutase